MARASDLCVLPGSVGPRGPQGLPGEGGEPEVFFEGAPAKIDFRANGDGTHRLVLIV